MAIFYTKNDKFRWECGDVRIEFSAPVIQAYNEYIEISSMSEVMYFYYTVKFYKKAYSSWNEETDEEIKKWKLVSQRNVYDFPCIEQLQYIIENIIKKTDSKDCQKIKYSDGTTAFLYTMETEGFVCEDVYKVTKLFSEKKDARYSLYAGCTFDLQGDQESTGIYVNQLNEEELGVLLDCVNSFLDFSIGCHNQDVVESRQAHLNSLQTIDGKLYKYKINHYNVMYGQIDVIYSVGDKVDLYTEPYDKDLLGAKITGIEEDSITVRLNKKSYTVSFPQIYHIYEKISDEALYYNIDEIEDDFKNFLSPIMIDDFKNLSVVDLLEKYGDAIIARTWMCRSEHNLPLLTTDNGNHENVYANVKNIITKIKEELLTN